MAASSRPSRRPIASRIRTCRRISTRLRTPFQPGRPADGGLGTPLGTAGRQADPDVQADLGGPADGLPARAPGKVGDPVARVPHPLYLASVVDLVPVPTEPFVPLLILDQIQASVP